MLNRNESISMRSDYSDFTPQKANMSLREYMGQSSMCVSSPKVNFYDVKSQKNLNYLLKGGYSCKFHEKKYYNASKAMRKSSSKQQLINTLNASSIARSMKLIR